MSPRQTARGRGTPVLHATDALPLASSGSRGKCSSSARASTSLTPTELPPEGGSSLWDRSGEQSAKVNSRRPYGQLTFGDSGVAGEYHLPVKPGLVPEVRVHDLALDLVWDFKCRD